MIRLPVLHELSVDEYGLYPGTQRRPGLSFGTRPGLTLVLGANGLGKTTLVTILFRMLSGPADIPNIATGRELGNRKLDAAPLLRDERRLFAMRVNDDAKDAVATLQFTLGSTTFDLTRSLADLQLLELAVDGVPHDNASETAYQDLVCEGARLASFGDWILILRHLVFYFEDRRELVWDPTAQRELLRLLFLSVEDTRRWTSSSREILAKDSLYRNLGYAFRKSERTLTKVERKVGTADEIRQQLEILEPLQADEQEELYRLEDDLTTADASRKRARLDALAAEQEHESAMRSVEQHQLSSITSAFPSASDTAKYLIGQILADKDCLACGSTVPDFANELEARVRNGLCTICGSESRSESHDSTGVRRILTQAIKKLDAAEARLLAATAERDSAETAFSHLITRIAELNASISDRSQRIEELVRLLPPDDQSVRNQRSELATLQGRYESLSMELMEMRGAFSSFVSSVNHKIVAQKDAIKRTFDDIAAGFLLEECTLVWAPRKARLGESGELIEFAAFELAMTGADFGDAVRRSGPQQVSESQREFIDLAFRMALMSAASEAGATLIVDAPESSLDAVFVTRAADVLTHFATRNSENRLIVTSNLIDGNLIPELLKRSGISSSRDRRVVDLLRIAAPTAATKKLQSEYASVRRRLFARAQEIR